MTRSESRKALSNLLSPSRSAMASNSTSDTNVPWFIYRGPDGEAVPRDVTHLRVHPSVTVIPAGAFKDRRQLQQVDLPDGLRNLGMGHSSVVGY